MNFSKERRSESFQPNFQEKKLKKYEDKNKFASLTLIENWPKNIIEALHAEKCLYSIIIYYYYSIRIFSIEQVIQHSNVSVHSTR